MAVWHDLPFFLTGNLDYLAPAMNEAYRAVAISSIAKYARQHLRRPLPMMRW